MMRKPWFWAGLLLAAAVIVGAMRLRFDADIMNLLPSDLPVVEGLKLYQRHFTDSRELIVTVRAPTATEAETAARSLAETMRAQSNLVASVMWQPVWQERPALAAELLAYLWLNQPPSDFNAMAGRMQGTNINATLDDAREQLGSSMSPMGMARQYDPYGLLNLPENVTSGAGVSFGQGDNIFASRDGNFRILFVKAKPGLSHYRACIAWMKEIHAVLGNRSEPQSGATIGLTGGPAFVAEISGGMEHDMQASVGITSAIIAVLFWFFHRRVVPMLWLLTLLAVILACTLALGGLFFGAINVVSLGFAAILLGLAVDYGVVHYQEAMASPNAIIPEIRAAIGPSIFWAAVTTIAAFLSLNFGGLPGLAQLGSLVAVGVTLSALVMLFAFLPPLFRDRIKRRQMGLPSPAPQQTHKEFIRPVAAPTAAGVTVVLILASATILINGVPRMDRTGDALRPLNSPAYSALAEIKTNLAQNREPMWLLARGRDETEIARKLDGVEPILKAAVSNHVVSGITLPTPIWPRRENQENNRTLAAKLVADRNSLREAAGAKGFGTNAFALTGAIFDTWQSAASHPGVFWPTNEMSQWVMGKVAAETPDGFLAAGYVFATNTPHAAIAGLSQELTDKGFILSGWDLLGPSILARVQQNLWKMLVPMIGLVLLSLWLAFRRWTEILLGLAVLALSGICLLAVMRLAGWSWNLLNLMALPLMLGTGVDYSIFMQLALRRHGGDAAAAHHSVGRALLLCGGTAVAGFGSLALSTNAGMASLGKVCAVGIAGNMLISVLLLPAWWRKFAMGNSGAKTAAMGPSAFYRAEVWRLGMAVARMFSRNASIRLAQAFTGAYWSIAWHRREIVISNLQPALHGDRARAEKTGRELMRHFGTKVVDLLRYESGLPTADLIGQWTGWEHFQAAQAKGRGVLLVTPHLGNWEFGAPLLTQRGVKLQVVTLAEPGRGFTELRKASRAKWDVDTLVIGDDPFAAVEVIRRLEAGAAVALLIDRPPPGTEVMVELFGKPFPVSLAAAELARASGCAVQPVYLPANGNGYDARMLPAIEYNRAGLRQLEERRKLTQQIMSALEPAIREHLDQWYHFVPVWRNSGSKSKPDRPA